VSGSDRAAEKWRADYRIEGTEALQLHHLYRAMAWLGEPLADPAGASELTPRCRKDLVEEGLFARRRDLFAELSVVFMDTTRALPGKALIQHKHVIGSTLPFSQQPGSGRHRREVDVALCTYSWPRR
jgi:hypothetical protein